MKKNYNTDKPNDPNSNGVGENVTESPTQKTESAAEWQANIYM